MPLFIRPVHKAGITRIVPDVGRPFNGTDVLTSIALCRTKGTVMTDGDIVAHFAPDASGLEITAEARLTYGAVVIEWGPIIWT